MIISEIKLSPDKKHCTIVLENGEKIRMATFLAAEYDIFALRDIPEDKLEQLRKDAGLQRTKERAIRSVSASMVSKGALLQKLEAFGGDEKNAEAAVKWLSDLGLLDDKKTGESIVCSAVAKGYGIHRIKQILREKRIPQEYWEELLASVPSMDETIDKLIQRKLKSDNPDKKELSRIADSLLRMGHSWQDIKAGFSRLETDIDLEEE